MSDYKHLPREFVEQVQRFAYGEEVQLILDALIAKYTESWRNTSPEQADRREHYWRMQLAVEGLKTEIRGIAQDELVSAHNLGLQNKTNWSKI